MKLKSIVTTVAIVGLLVIALYQQLKMFELTGEMDRLKKQYTELEDLINELTRWRVLNSTTLKFWYESCGVGYPNGTCICGVALGYQVTLPQTFNMSTILLTEGQEVITLHSYYYGAQLDSGTKILFSINATAPIDFLLVLINRTEPDVYALGNEVGMVNLAEQGIINLGYTPGRIIINTTEITRYYHELNVQQTGLYIFVFYAVEPKPVATVTFSLR